MRMMIFCEMWISWAKGGLVSSSILVLVTFLVPLGVNKLVMWWGKDQVEVSKLNFYNLRMIYFSLLRHLLAILCLKTFFRCFELAYGLKVNFFKSKLIGIEADESSLFRYAFILNCNMTSIPFVYLDISIGANSRREITWIWLCVN